MKKYHESSNRRFKNTSKVGKPRNLRKFEPSFHHYARNSCTNAYRPNAFLSVYIQGIPHYRISYRGSISFW